jgi:rubrerythrin
MKNIIYLAPGVPQELKWKCKKCGSKYGRQPDNGCPYCGSFNIKKIKTCNS